MWKPFKVKNKRAIGDQYEQQAYEHLKKQGLKLRDKNASFRFGEIDLIMLDGEQLVFIEVRYRHSKDFGGAAASINTQKQKKLIKAAQLYLQKHYKNNPPSCRFDVIAIDGKLKTELEWIKNAFYAG